MLCLVGDLMKRVGSALSAIFRTGRPLFRIDEPARESMMRPSSKGVTLHVTGSQSSTEFRVSMERSTRARPPTGITEWFQHRFPG
jgi:hypothetical protein